MTKALGIKAHPKMVELAKTIHNGHKSFRELNWENQVLLAESNLKLDGLVTEEELQQYEIEKSVREAENPIEQVRARVIQQINNVRTRLDA